MFAASNVLKYNAEEVHLGAHVLMNLRPTILAHSAFLWRSRKSKDLINAVGLIEEN